MPKPDSTRDRESTVVDAMLSFYASVGNEHDGMYPIAKCIVEAGRKVVILGGVELSPKEFRDILVSVSGRGVVLDFEGYEGKPPKWLYDQALMPAGYVSKTPKLPKL